MSPRKGVRILSICDDERIRFSRELVLMHEGYEVESVTSNTPLDVGRVRSFHIAILCHSLAAYRASQIAHMLRRYNPSIGVIRVHSLRVQMDSFYDVDCEVLPGPDAMLEGIRALAMRMGVPESRSERKQA
jgi:hypothetical protein